MKKLFGSVAALAMIQSANLAAAPSNDELWQIIQNQQAEIKQLKQEQEETKKDVANTDAKVEAAADAIEKSSATGAAPKALEWAEKTKMGGYGEHHYNNFNGKTDQVDAHRYVLYVSHEYSDTVHFFSELELEHSLAGDGKPGEVELEQAFIEWRFTENHSLIAGQFLVPVGILNETHEPDSFYGTERNVIENAVIPSTWWETGVMLHGELAPGLSYNFALHSGLKNSEANIRSARQKSAKADASEFAYTARIKYTAIPGLELATTFQRQDDMSQGQLEDASATLFEAHGIYSMGPFSLRALWANWDVNGSEADLIGKDSQKGYYVEPSIKATEKLGFFVRYSNWNNTAGLSTSQNQEVTDFGLNFWLHPNVVFKADYSDHAHGSDSDSLNLGVGWSF